MLPAQDRARLGCFQRLAFAGLALAKQVDAAEAGLVVELDEAPEASLDMELPGSVEE